MEFVNLTPHALTIEGIGTVPPSGTVAYVTRMSIESRLVGGIPTLQQSFGAVEGLPDPRDGVALIVSALVLSALAGSRNDVFAPDTGPDAIRENGQIVAVKGLVQ